MSSANYPKEARLHRPSEFAHVFSNRRIIRGALFTLHHHTSPNQETARLGLVIAKRNAVRATTRSTIKRVIRDVFRHKRSKLAKQDFVIRLHRPIENCSLTQLRQIVRADIEPLFDKWC